MTQTIRQPEILLIARRDGKVTVEGLATELGVTLQTIRRDLTEISEAGLLERVHGGAILPSGTVNLGYGERRRVNASGKASMARACAAQIPDGSTVFLNIGTSTEAVATELRQHLNLLVVTNNMNVANILAQNTQCEVIVTGGALRLSDGGLIGDITTTAIRQFKFDFGVIGCSAVDAEGDILDFDLEEVGVSRTILERSRASFLLADHTKFKRLAPALIAPLSSMDAIFTDRAISHSLAEQCELWQTQVNIQNATAP